MARRKSGSLLGNVVRGRVKSVTRANTRRILKEWTGQPSRFKSPKEKDNK